MEKHKLNIAGWPVTLSGKGLDSSVEEYINAKFEDFQKKTHKKGKATSQQILSLIVNITNELLNERNRVEHLKEEMLYLVKEIENNMDLLS